MQPGRELDELVAEKVLGWNVFMGTEIPESITMRDVPEDRRHLKRVWVRGGVRMACEECGDMPAFSEDISAAFRVVEEIRGCGFNVTIGFSWVFEAWVCECSNIFTKKYYTKIEFSQPMAICLAALKAVGVEVPA